MRRGEIYTIKLGKYSDKYLVMMNTPDEKSIIQLRRVMLPKTKIDAVRLPEIITISYFGTPITGTTKRKSKKLTNQF